MPKTSHEFQNIQFFVSQLLRISFYKKVFLFEKKFFIYFYANYLIIFIGAQRPKSNLVGHVYNSETLTVLGTLYPEHVLTKHYLPMPMPVNYFKIFITENITHVMLKSSPVLKKPILYKSQWNSMMIRILTLF